MRKLAVFSAGYAGAIFAATLILPEGAILPLGGFCAVLWWLLFLLKRILPDRPRRYALLCSAGMTVGLLWNWGYGRLVLEPVRQLDDRTVVQTGTVSRFPQTTDYGGKVLVRVETQGGTKATALLYIDREYMHLVPGERISTIAHCTLATHTKDGEEITYYTAKGILLTAVAYGELTGQKPDRIPLTCVPAYLSREMNENIERVFPKDAAPLINAVVTGNRENLSDGFTSSLQRTGLAHTVSVSGMHLAYLAGFLALLLGRGSRRSALVSLPVIFLFTLVAGSTHSVVRAAIMIVLLQIAPLLGRERDDFTALAFALLLLLAHNPYAAAGVGLQLSFSAVAGIFLFSGKLYRRMSDCITLKRPGRNPARWLWNTLVRFVFSTLATTLGAMVFTTPLTAVYFGTVSLIAPLANLLTLWAVSAVFVGGIIAGLLGPIGSLAVLPVTLCARYLQWAIGLLGRLRFASVPAENPYYLLWLLFLYAVLTAGLLMPGRKRLWSPVLSGTVLLAAAILCTSLSFRIGEVTVQVLDVGQGQSVLIRSGTSLTLVDCGGDGYENAGTVAADRIQAMGYSTIDLLVISHCHADHANGVPELLNRIDVKEITLPDTDEEAELRGRILELARAKGITVRSVREEICLPAGEGARLTLYPPVGDEGANERGLTVLYSAGEYDVLMTGDMGAEAERELLALASLPDVELMVAGHHGSKHSNSQLLLETVRPDVAVVSVDADNNYGHPAAEALERFEAVGAQIYRTDLNGTVTVTGNPEPM